MWICFYCLCLNCGSILSLSTATMNPLLPASHLQLFIGDVELVVLYFSETCSPSHLTSTQSLQNSTSVAHSRKPSSYFQSCCHIAFTHLQYSSHLLHCDFSVSFPHYAMEPLREATAFYPSLSACSSAEYLAQH